MKIYTSPDNGSFWRNYLDKSYADGTMTKELYNAHLQIHEDSIKNHEKRMTEDTEPDLERDLRSSKDIHDKCISSEVYCRDLYAALCNNRFFYGEKEWACTWRSAGGIISDIIEKGDYVDWYVSGNEGNVTDEVRLDLTKIGWIIKPYEDNDLT